jgi:hypothetical protein
MKIFMLLFPVAALVLQVLLSKPFVVCLSVAVFAGMIAAVCLALKDAIERR